MASLSHPQIYSFDIFDTVLTRMVARPSDIFHLVKEKIKASRLNVPKPLSDCFCEVRNAAERKARKLSSKDDIYFDDIYDLIKNKFGLPSDTVNQIKSIELDCELNNIYPVAATIDHISSLRNQGKRIIFISDMYLPKKIMCQMLHQVGAGEDNDAIYISGELGLSKFHSTLYQHVLKEEQLSPDELIHFGDHFYSDYFIPSRLGIRCDYVPYSGYRYHTKMFLSQICYQFYKSKILK